MAQPISETGLRMFSRGSQIIMQKSKIRAEIEKATDPVVKEKLTKLLADINELETLYYQREIDSKGGAPRRRRRPHRYRFGGDPPSADALTGPGQILAPSQLQVPPSSTTAPPVEPPPTLWQRIVGKARRGTKRRKSRK